MFVKEGIICLVLFTWIMVIEGRPQVDSTIKTSEKLEPVSKHFIIILSNKILIKLKY